MPLKLLRLTLRIIERPVRNGVQESEFLRVEREVLLPLSTCALVLVDVWDRHHIASHQARCTQIIRSKIMPLVAAARQYGLSIIHAPGPEVAAHYPQCPSYNVNLPTLWFGQTVTPTLRAGQHPTLPVTSAPDEPPRDVVELRHNRRIASEVAPRDSEPVVANCDQLVRELESLGIETIFFAGFAANICLPYRDYGMRSVQAGGWKVVLVRDATTAVEFDESLEHELLLAAAIADIEMNYGSTVTTDAMLTALHNS